MKTYLALIRNDIRLAFRQRIVIFFNYLMPFAFFFIFAQSSHAEQGGAILQVNPRQWPFRRRYAGRAGPRNEYSPAL